MLRPRQRTQISFVWVASAVLVAAAPCLQSLRVREVDVSPGPSPTEMDVVPVEEPPWSAVRAEPEQMTIALGQDLRDPVEDGGAPSVQPSLPQGWSTSSPPAA